MANERVSRRCVPAESCSSAQRAVEWLGQTPLPAEDERRRHYRITIVGCVAPMDFDDLRALCVFFQCSVDQIVTRIMDWQYARAARRAALERSARRARRKAGRS